MSEYAEGCHFPLPWGVESWDDDRFEEERLRSLERSIAELPDDPEELARLVEQRYLLELLAWDNCPEWVALRRALSARSAIAPTGGKS